MKVDPSPALQLVKSAAPTTRFSDVMSKTSPLPPPLPHRAAAGSSGPKPVPPGMTPRAQVAHAASTATTLKLPQMQAARAQSHQATQQTLDGARASANAITAQLSEVRADGKAVTEKLFEVRAAPPPTPGRPPAAAESHLDRKMLDLICQELKSDPGVATKAANQNVPQGADRFPFPVQTAQAHSSDGAARSAQAVELIEKIEVFVKSQRPALALTLNNSLGARVEIERIGPREVALKVVGTDGPPKAEDLGRIREEMKARGLKVSALSVA